MFSTQNLIQSKSKGQVMDEQRPKKYLHKKREIILQNASKPIA